MLKIRRFTIPLTLFLSSVVVVVGLALLAAPARGTELPCEVCLRRLPTTTCTTVPRPVRTTSTTAPAETTTTENGRKALTTTTTEAPSVEATTATAPPVVKAVTALPTFTG